MAENTVILRLDNVSKSFAKVEHDEVTHALNEVNLSMKSGEFISLVGPSGCGKSTILRLVAGLIPPTTGYLTVNGAQITGPSPERGMMFQKPTLFPWLTVEKNISFSLKLQGKLKGNEEKVERMLKIIGLESFRNDYPGQLSGGQRQRGAIARMLAMRPKLMLFDEPSSSLDPSNVSEVLDIIRGLRGGGRTIIVVTHQASFARGMADSILIMEAGRIVSREDPAFVTVRPASEAGRNIFARGLPVISALDRVEAAGRVMLGVPPDLSGASSLPRVRALGAALGVPVEEYRVRGGERDLALRLGLSDLALVRAPVRDGENLTVIGGQDGLPGDFLICAAADDYLWLRRLAAAIR